MSAAIKRLSTIIRPHPHTSSASPQKESTKPESDNPIDAPAKPDTSMISKDNITTSPTATEPTMTETQAAPATEPVTSAEQPKEAQTMETTTGITAAAPATTETAQGEAATEEKSPAVDSSTTPATAEPSDTPKKTETKQDATSVKDKSSRRTRDIGRDTIRRFSTILRSGNGHQQPKDKESVPPVPIVPAKDETPAPTTAETKPAPTETTTATTTTAAAVTPTPAPIEKQKSGSDPKPVKAASKTKENEKTEKAKVAPRRGSSFFSAAREVVRGPQKNKSKSITKTEVAAVAPKKSLAKGKRVVVVTGASKGVGLEFVKQYAAQTDTFVIALSRTVDRSSEIRTLVKDSSKSGYVRPIRVDIGNPKSVASAVKEIVEITEGRIDLLIHAAGTKADPSLRMGDIKGPELEEDLRYNLVGPIALTNALLPFLKPAPPPEAPVEEAKPATATTDEMKKEEPMKSEQTEAKVEETKAEMAPVDASKEIAAPVEVTPAEATLAPTASGEPAMEPTTEPTTAPVEPTPMTTEESKEHTMAEVTTTDPTPSSEPGAATSDAVKPIETEEAPVKPVEEMAPAPPKPVCFPHTPYVVFLTPADSIVNERGMIPMGSAFLATPRTLFSLSRSSLQVAIAQYGMSLGRQVGVVGIERGGALDPHANVSDADAVKGVMECLPTITINQSGRLLRV